MFRKKIIVGSFNFKTLLNSLFPCKQRLSVINTRLLSFFSEKLAFLIPLYADARVNINGLRKVYVKFCVRTKWMI